MAIPLLASCCADDPTYDPYFARIHSRVAVRFNGSVIRDVIAYDCREGWVRFVRYRNHTRGNSSPEVRGGLGTERTLYGDVAVSWK